MTYPFVDSLKLPGFLQESSPLLVELVSLCRINMHDVSGTVAAKQPKPFLHEHFAPSCSDIPQSQRRPFGANMIVARPQELSSH